MFYFGYYPYQSRNPAFWALFRGGGGLGVLFVSERERERERIQLPKNLYPKPQT